MNGAGTAATISDRRLAVQPPDSFIEVRDPHTGKMLFRYDPERRLVEIVRRGVKTLVDLAEYE